MFSILVISISAIPIQNDDSSVIQSAPTKVINSVLLGPPSSGKETIVRIKVLMKQN